MELQSIYCRDRQINHIAIVFRGDRRLELERRGHFGNAQKDCERPLGRSEDGKMPPIANETIEQVIDRLVAELSPEQIILFGSYAWGQPNKYSDIDLCVIVTDGIPGFNRVEWAIKGREAIRASHTLRERRY